MVKEIVWTQEAVDSFDEVFLFLLHLWNLKIASAFV
jgi:plasmid stabilization system protein ParE